MPALSFELILVIILAVVLGIVLKAYDGLMREVRRMKKEREEIEMRARSRALKIVDEARDRALEILTSAEVQTDEEKDELGQKVHDALKEQLGEYKQSIQNISKQIEEESLRELSELKQSLSEHSAEIQNTFDKRLTEKLGQADKEVEAYKARRMAEINSRMKKFVEEVVTKAAGKVVASQDQEPLILEALEEIGKRYEI